MASEPYIFDDSQANVRRRSTAAFPGKTAWPTRRLKCNLEQCGPSGCRARNGRSSSSWSAARVGGKPVFQGFLIDWAKLQGLLKDEVTDLFPDVRMIPLPPGEPPHPERAMTVLPVEFDPLVEPLPEQPLPVDPESVPAAGWTPLRIGLTFAWGAVLIALFGVGLGGWTLLDLSERRIRFVSAVTHELRTPLTTLRLYLDLLSSGLVTEETQKAEYLTTLNAEADRLHRLIGNVLDFARLEKSRPAVEKRTTGVFELLGQLVQLAGGCAYGPGIGHQNKLPHSSASRPIRVSSRQVIGNLSTTLKILSRCERPRIVLRAATWTESWRSSRGSRAGRHERTLLDLPAIPPRPTRDVAGGVGLRLAWPRGKAHLLGGKLASALVAKASAAPAGTCGGDDCEVVRHQSESEDDACCLCRPFGVKQLECLDNDLS